MQSLIHKLIELLSGFVGITILMFLIAGSIPLASSMMSQRRRPTLTGLWRHYFPADPWRTSNVRIDVFFYFATKATDKLFVVVTTLISVAIGGCVASTIGHAFPVHATYRASPAALIVLSLVFFLFCDFANYLTHLLQHKVPMLWEFHKVHHSSIFLNPLTTARMHPLGNEFDGVVAAILTSLPIGLAQYYFRLSAVDCAALLGAANFIGTVVVLDPLRHSHFPVGFGPLDRILVSPHMHHLHHSTLPAHWDKNLGNKLSIWDWAFGTAFKPVKGEAIDFGVGTIEDARGDYSTLFGCYVGPFVKNYQMLQRWTRGESFTAADKARFYTQRTDRAFTGFGSTANDRGPQYGFGRQPAVRLSNEAGS